MTYSEWFKEIKWLKDKVILPGNIRVSKSAYITSKGFDFDEFNKRLMTEYNESSKV